MSKADYGLLQDVIMDADFPDLDLALRRGRHVDRDDGAWYGLLTDAQELLEPFYRRYGCELIHKTDGYFYLLPTGEKVSRKQLSATDMLVGQALALLYLDPAAVERGGVVTQEEVVGQLSAVLGTDTLIAAFNPGKRKSKDERIAQRNVRQRVAEAVRRLASLGFVELNEASAVRLRSALLRFAEPVRGLSEPAEALAKLVAQGEVALAPEQAADELEEQDGEAITDGSRDSAESVSAAASSSRDARAKREAFAETLSGFHAPAARAAEPEEPAELLAVGAAAARLASASEELGDGAGEQPLHVATSEALDHVAEQQLIAAGAVALELVELEQLGDVPVEQLIAADAVALELVESEGLGAVEDTQLLSDADAVDTSVRRRPGAVDDELLSAETPAAESGEQAPEPEDDRDLEWADIWPGAEKDGEEAS